MRRATVSRMAKIAIGILVAGNLYRIALAVSGASRAAMTASTFSRLDPIALGILLAVFTHKIPQLSRWQRVALFLSGWLSWIAVFEVCRPHTPRMALGYPVAALASAAILVSFLGSQHPFLRNKQLLYLGKISYGLYVFHEFGLWSAFRLVPTAGSVSKMVQIGLGLALTVLCAAASYRWLESPFLKLKERFSYVPSRPV